MTALYTTCAVLIALCALGGFLFGSLLWGMFTAVAVIVGILIFLGDDDEHS